MREEGRREMEPSRLDCGKRLAMFIPSPRVGRNGKPQALWGTNEIYDIQRSGAGFANKFKRDEMARISWIAKAAMASQRWKCPDEPVRIKFVWVETHRGRDQDNIRGYEKYILDGLVKAGAISDDSQKCIDGFTENEMRVDPMHPGVQVYIDTVPSNTETKKPKPIAPIARRAK